MQATVAFADSQFTRVQWLRWLFDHRDDIARLLDTFALWRELENDTHPETIKRRIRLVIDAAKVASRILPSEWDDRLIDQLESLLANEAVMDLIADSLSRWLPAAWIESRSPRTSDFEPSVWPTALDALLKLLPAILSLALWWHSQQNN